MQLYYAIVLTFDENSRKFILFAVISPGSVT